MIKLSLIIPIYKVEKYIIECIESICCQLVDGVEIILVNDGTPDQSMKMAEEYINNRYIQYLSQFIFIHQENKGQSSARNEAIKVANGKYLGFLDSDDYLLKGYFYTILNIFDKYDNIDIIHFNAKQYDELKETYVESINFVRNKSIIRINESYRERLFDDSHWYPWLRIIKKDIISRYEFILNVYMEDKLFFPDIYYDDDVKNIMEIDEYLICYRHRVGSSIRSGYNKALLMGVDLGMEKFSKKKYPLFSLIYTQFFIRKISILLDQGENFKEIYNFICVNKKHMDLNYKYTYKVWILKKVSFMYLILLILKKNMIYLFLINSY